MFVSKFYEHGDRVRAKARLVAPGFKQSKCIIFFETFASTPAASCFCLLGAIACRLGLVLCHLVAEQAFGQASMDEHIFMRLPPGCREISGKLVWLNRSLYGLTKASR